ncbi:actin-like ATPase domain-containing protein [Schizophyllum commune H4-8]|uniref:Actin-related protein n=1 Tax=Schizophyllum commune (strain H4-8 / FGSC 9210) TaxID=578458 RepID=D8Q3L9_SCHCM|nr:actin-like ATPase domain-containing protein [Schizophyllum commune H4-8]KAI5894960.1 actin-like ATPase domain-containing protein [Schizophyllum commune H4-8]
MSFRDNTVVVLETGRDVIYAGQGLHELLRTPAVYLNARVGLRTQNAQSSSPAVSDYLVGKELEEALSNGQDNIQVSYPFADGDIGDWTQAEAIWKHVLFKQLGLRRLQMESPVILSIFPGLSRDAYERICKLFFERFNVAGFTIIERPVSQLYAANAVSGVVVDIGNHATDVTPIYDAVPIYAGRLTTSIGLRDCERYLAHLLRANPSVMGAISPSEAPLPEDALETALLELVHMLWEQDHIRPPSHGEQAATQEDEGITDIGAIVAAGKEKAIIENGMRKKATAKQTQAEQARQREIEALDLITVKFREKEITLGKERHRFCEPLFDVELVDRIRKVEAEEPKQPHISLQEAVNHAISLGVIDQRQYLWRGLFVTGDITRHVSGIGAGLRSRCQPFIVKEDVATDVQPRTIHTLHIPEYYPEYRDSGDCYAAYLGSSITAKIIFHDPHAKNFVSKSDYATYGPRVILESSTALL